MRRILFLFAAAIGVCLAAWAQVRITSLNSNGALSWTNSSSRGIYTVETAASPVGPWNPLPSVADYDPRSTNTITTQVPITNAQAFYRVAWQAPNVTGVWDYQGYEYGNLVVTGQLTLVTENVFVSDPSLYRVGGFWNLDYTGLSNGVPYYSPLIGTGSLYGVLTSNSGYLYLVWPTNCNDCEVELSGPVGSINYTGRWSHFRWDGPRAGYFNATRIASTNLIH